jgi:hypothetical protein
MLILGLLEVIFAVVCVWVLVMEICTPALFGLPLFPSFRRKWRRVDNDLQDVLHSQEFEKWVAEVTRQREKLKKEDSSNG